MIVNLFPDLLSFFFAYFDVLVIFNIIILVCQDQFWTESARFWQNYRIDIDLKAAAKEVTEELEEG